MANAACSSLSCASSSSSTAVECPVHEAMVNVPIYEKRTVRWNALASTRLGPAGWCMGTWSAMSLSLSSSCSRSASSCLSSSWRYGHSARQPHTHTKRPVGQYDVRRRTRPRYMCWTKWPRRPRSRAASAPGFPTSSGRPCRLSCAPRHRQYRAQVGLGNKEEDAQLAVNVLECACGLLHRVHVLCVEACGLERVDLHFELEARVLQPLELLLGDLLPSQCRRRSCMTQPEYSSYKAPQCARWSEDEGKPSRSSA